MPWISESGLAGMQAIIDHDAKEIAEAKERIEALVLKLDARCDKCGSGPWDVIEYHYTCPMCGGMLLTEANRLEAREAAEQAARTLLPILRVSGPKEGMR